jgi:hypothetical protein
MTTDVFAGAIIMGNVIAFVFFWRFWHRTRDKLFLMFGAAFLLLAVHRGLLEAMDVAREEQSWHYLIRLVAFLLIIVAILLKNAESKGPSS